MSLFGLGRIRILKLQINQSKISPTPSREEKIKRWEVYYKQYFNHIDSLYKETGDDRILTLFQKENEGGQCNRCKKEWKKIEFKNLYLIGTYYQPDCFCYNRCINCHAWLYYETVVGSLLKRCPMCGLNWKKRQVKQIDPYRLNKQCEKCVYWKHRIHEWGQCTNEDFVRLRKGINVWKGFSCEFFKKRG